MRCSLFIFFALVVTFSVLLTGFGTLAQGYAPPSGCRTSTLKNTLTFTQMRTGNPGDQNVVIGAYTITDEELKDTSLVRNANCTPPNFVDGYPTHVTALTVTLTGGDQVAADVKKMRLYLDNNGDGFFQADRDTQLGSDLSGDCLYTRKECVFSFGRATPLFTVNAGTSKTVVITIDLGRNTRAESNLVISLTAEANDVIAGIDNISSDFHDDYRTQISNIILNSRTGGLPWFPGINNGRGAPETGARSLEFTGITSRYNAKPVVAGAQEVIASLLHICEGGTPLVQTGSTKSAVSFWSTAIVDYPRSLPCATVPEPDQFGTRILRIRVGVSGNAEAVGTTMDLWDDANDNGILFEEDELVASAKLIGGVAIFGSFKTPLLAKTRPDAYPAPGMYARQENPPLTCNSRMLTPKPRGTSKGCPHVLALTFNVDNTASAGEVFFNVVLDVGELPSLYDEIGVPRSSNQITTAPLRSKVKIIDLSSKSLAQRVAERFGNPTKIEDVEILWALGKWARNEPISDLRLSDAEMIRLIDLWARGVTIMR
jgi:hypothetical protein